MNWSGGEPKFVVPRPPSSSMAAFKQIESGGGAPHQYSQAGRNSALASKVNHSDLRVWRTAHQKSSASAYLGEWFFGARLRGPGAAAPHSFWGDESKIAKTVL